MSGDTAISHSFYIIPQGEIKFLYLLWHGILFIVTTPLSISSKFLSPNCQCSMIMHVHNRGHTVTVGHHCLPSNWISPYTQSDPAETRRGGSTLGSQLQAHLFFMTSTTPRNMITKSRMPAITPAILTVWSVCFSGSGTGFGVTAPGDGKESKWVRQNKDITFKFLPLHLTEERDLSEPADRRALISFFFPFFLSRFPRC